MANYIEFQDQNGERHVLDATPPTGNMTRRQLIPNTDFTLSTGPVIEALMIAAQETSAGAWTSLWWGLAGINTPQSHSSTGWYSNNSGGLLRAPHTFDQLQDVYITYTASSGGSEIQADSVTVDPNNNRRAVATFSNVDNLMDIELDLTMGSCCCLQNSPGNQVVNHTITVTVGDFSSNWSSFSFSMSNIRMTYTSGIEYASNYFGIVLEHTEPYNVMEELYLNLDIDAELDFNSDGTMIQVGLMLTFDIRNVSSSARMTMALYVDQGLITTGVPNGEMMEIQSFETMEVPQVWDGQTQTLKIHLGAEEPPVINNINVLNAIKTEVKA